MSHELSKLRILHVADCYEGGVGRAIDTIAEVLPEPEHHFLWRGSDNPAKDERYASLRLLPRAPHRAVGAVRDAVRRIKPDVVHAHSSWGGAFARATSLGVPVVYQPHAYKFEDTKSPWPVRKAYFFAEKLLASRAHSIAVLSPHENALARRLNRNVPIHYLPNVATRTPDDLHAGVNWQTGREVLMIGRAANQKSPHFYAEVANLVRERDPSVKFRWIGDGPLRAVLDDAGIEVSGWIAGDDLSRELARPALYFHTALYEGFPLSVLDAAAFEHPVAARQIPAFDGTGIPVADSVDGAATLILEIINDGAASSDAIASAEHFNATMNRTRQRDGLRAIYDSATRAQPAGRART